MISLAVDAAAVGWVTPGSLRRPLPPAICLPSRHSPRVPRKRWQPNPDSPCTSCHTLSLSLPGNRGLLDLRVLTAYSCCHTMSISLSCWLQSSDSLAILSYIVSLAVRHYLVDFSLAFLPYVVSLANTISLTSESWHPSPSYHTQSHSHGRRITHSKVLTSPSCHPLPPSLWHHLSESATLTVPPHPIHTSSRSRWRHIPIQQNRNTVHQLSWLGKDTLIITRYNYNC